MSLEPLSPVVRDYLRAFDLTAVIVTPDGRIGLRRDPTGAVAAWWCEAGEAGRVIRKTNEQAAWPASQSRR